MSAENLERSVELVFGHEGGYVNNPKDPGGPTKYGITLKTLSAWRGKACTASDVRALSLPEASQILRKQYWAPIRGDDLPSGLDHALFDYAVNSGPAQAVKTLQRCLGVNADGIMGAQTLNAIASKQEPVALIDALCNQRLKFLRGLKTWWDFRKGWSCRIERVRGEAKAMVKGLKALQLASPKEGFESADPAETALSATIDGKGAATAGIGVLGTALSDAATQLAPYTNLLPILRWLFIGLTIAGIGVGLYATLKRLKMGAL